MPFYSAYSAQKVYGRIHSPASRPIYKTSGSISLDEARKEIIKVMGRKKLKTAYVGVWRGNVWGDEIIGAISVKNGELHYESLRNDSSSDPYVSEYIVNPKNGKIRRV